MKVIAKIGNPLPPYNILYKKFASRCLSEPENLEPLKNDFTELKDIFVRGRQVEKFCSQTTTLVNNLTAGGKFKLANIFTGEVGKLYMQIGQYKKAEPYILLSKQISKEFNDNLHVLARLNDLEIIYKKLGWRHSMFAVFKEKKDCIKYILKNYEKNANNYCSIHRAPTALEAVKIQLAYTYTGLAKLLMHNKPQDGIRALEKAGAIYAELGKAKELHYLEEKINRIRTQFGGI